MVNQKERIIEVTTALINENQGDLTLVTARKIADRAEVGLGLINYHFGSKDQLVTECVQKILSEQIKIYAPSEETDGGTVEEDEKRLSDWAKQIFEFLYTNRSIVSISILGDMRSNQTISNSVYTQMGLEKAIRSNIDDRKKKQMIFALTSTMQGAFMQNNVVNSRLGYDFSQKEDREQYIDSLVHMLFMGVSNA